MYMYGVSSSRQPSFNGELPYSILPEIQKAYSNRFNKKENGRHNQGSGKGKWMGDNFKGSHARPCASIRIRRYTNQTSYSSKKVQGQKLEIPSQGISRTSEDANIMDTFIFPFDCWECKCISNQEIYRTTMG